MDSRAGAVAPTLRPVSAGALAARTLRAWRPQRTPRLTTLLIVWLLGLGAAFLGNLPPPSDAAVARYATKMKQAETFLPARRDAQQAFFRAEAAAYQATPYFWWFRPASHERVYAARRDVATAERALRAAEKEWLSKVRDAKRELGLWSEPAAEEARAAFWRSYADGKRFAVRHTMWDILVAVMTNRTGAEEGTASFVLNWLMRVLANFTAGMISAVINFMVGLPGLIYSFGPSIVSGLLFFLVCSVCATSVVTAYLVALYGTAAVGVAAAASAARTARLEGRFAGGQGRVRYRAHQM